MLRSNQRAGGEGAVQATVRAVPEEGRPHKAAEVPAGTGWCGGEKAENATEGSPATILSKEPSESNRKAVMFDRQFREGKRKKKRFSALWGDKICMSETEGCVGYMGWERN